MNVLLRLEAAPRRQEFPQEQKDWMLLPLKAPYEIRIDMRTFDYPSRWEAKSRKRSGLVTPATEAESNRSRLQFRGMGGLFDTKQREAAHERGRLEHTVWVWQQGAGRGYDLGVVATTREALCGLAESRSPLDHLKFKTARGRCSCH